MIKLTGLTALVLVLARAPVEAQVPGVDLKLGVRAGIYRPAGDLAEFFGSSARLERGPAIGASAEFKLPLLPLSLRGHIDYVLPTDALLNGQRLTGGNSLLMLTADLKFRMAPPLIPIEPYLFAGGGVKRYNFDDRFATALATFSDRENLTVRVGAGLGLTLGRFSLVAEASNLLSRFHLDETDDSTLQNDIFGMIGLQFALF